MKAYEIFQEMLPETALSIFQYLRDEQREVYTASLSSLAANRKLRPVFIQRKPGKEQVSWMAKNTKLKGSNEIAEHVLQLWLLKAHQKLLITFLEGLGIEHDGEGAAEDIPDKIDAKKLKSTVTKLLKDYDEETVRIYLHAFQMQRSDGWQEITDLISETPALQFGEPEVAPAKEEDSPEPAKEESETKAPAKKAAAKKTATKKAAAKKKST